MRKRSGMAPVYVGDIGEITPRVERKPLPDIDLDTLSYRELFNIAINMGVPLKDLIGVNHCYEHAGMIATEGRALPTGYNWCEHLKYCKNCFVMFRVKKLCLQ